MTLTIPIHAINPLNKRQHWRAVSARGKREKQTTAIYLYRAGKLPPLPVIVTLTRIGKRRCDSDGVAASLKHVRDAIAKAYGVDDGDARYDWRYEQTVGKEYGVRVDLLPAANTGEAR